MAVLRNKITPRPFIKLFKARIDRVMLFSRGKEISQQIKRGEFELITRAEAHLNGSARMGFYNMLDDMTVPWAQVIFSHDGPSKNIARDSVMLQKELIKLGINGVRRETGMFQEEVYKVWLFFEPSISAKKLRYFLFLLYEKLGFSPEIPIIPTTDTLSPGDLGHPVWLPYFSGIDKWMDKEGNPYDGLGVKQDKTVFVDYDGKAFEINMLTVPRNSERDIDQAIVALNANLKNKYLPGVGLIANADTARQMLHGCKAMKAIVDQIESTGAVSEDGLVRLATLLRGLGQEDMLQDYFSKVTLYEEKKFEKVLERYEGIIFPDCLSMKQLDFCPPGQACFPKTAPLTERLGFWREAKNDEKTLEPTMAGWFYKAVNEYVPPEPGEEGGEGFGDDIPYLDAPSMGGGRAVPRVVKIEVENISSYLDSYEQELDKLQSARKEISGLNSGFDGLNDALDGLNPGTLILLGGEPGAGKSTLAKQILDQVVDKESTLCLYVSYDLSTAELHRKSLCRLTGISYKQIKRGELTEPEWAKVRKVSKYIKDKFGQSVYILEAGDEVNTDGLAQAIDKSGASFTVVDYLQAMPNPARNAADPAQAHLMNLAALKRLARSKGIPILVISNGPMGRELKYGADVALYLNPLTNVQISASDKAPFVSLLNVEKNREGLSKVTLQYSFFPPRMIYYGEKRVEYKSALAE